jgi:predicted phosphodiesterase
VRLGIIADIHGNDVALRAVLNDAARLDVDRWWALGDLVLFGPRPVLGVHASPRADDGPGIEPGITDEELRTLLAGCGADVVIGGHTHFTTDRFADGIRALNPGSAGMPRTCGAAGWLLLEDDGDALTITHRSVPFDVDAVVSDLRRRRHPNAEFVASILTGQRQQIRAPSGK